MQNRWDTCSLFMHLKPLATWCLFWVENVLCYFFPLFQLLGDIAKHRADRLDMWVGVDHAAGNGCPELQSLCICKLLVFCFRESFMAEGKACLKDGVFLTASFSPKLHRKSRLFFKYWHQEQLAKYVERLERAAAVIQKGEHWGRRVSQLWSQTRTSKNFCPVSAPPKHFCRWQTGQAPSPCGVRVYITVAHLLSAHPPSERASESVSLAVVCGEGLFASGVELREGKDEWSTAHSCLQRQAEGMKFCSSFPGRICSGSLFLQRRHCGQFGTPFCPGSMRSVPAGG